MRALLRGNYIRCSRRSTSSRRPYFTQSDEGIGQPSAENTTVDTLRIARLVHEIKSLGHFCAALDPLRRTEFSDWAYTHSPRLVKLFEDWPSINLEPFQLQHLDLDQRLFLPALMLDQIDKSDWTLREIIHTLKANHCGSVGLEVAHCTDTAQRRWLRSKLASFQEHFSYSGKRRLLRQIMEAHLLEQLMHNKFPSSKRFGSEGCEALIPALHAALARSSRLGVTHVEMGMSHRARLSVLANVFLKPVGALCAQFEAGIQDQGHGDVMYHLGTAAVLDYSEGPTTTANEHQVHIELAPNPSHLEAVNPVVLGKTRYLQHALEDSDRTKVMSLLIHGDAAFIGQGVNAESLELSDLTDYRTGGTVHIVVNNQIGFTTNPQTARSSPFPTDMALMVRAPILHVNGDDVEAVARAMQVAVEYRQHYHSDIVVDIVCYRRRGHNELDNPAITQPQTTRAIKEHPHVFDVYKAKLIQSGVMTAEELQQDETRYAELLAAELEATRSGEYSMLKPELWKLADWNHQNNRFTDFRPSGVPLPIVQHVANQISRIPSNFNLHPDVHKMLLKRQKMAQGKLGINMAFAEALAFGTLLRRYSCTEWEAPHYERDDERYFAKQPDNEWTHIRLSGQDVERGTFNQRHAILWDQDTSQPYIPLNNIATDEPVLMRRWENEATGYVEEDTEFVEDNNSGQQQQFRICNSSLSEAAVAAFEYGYSLQAQGEKQTGSRLVIWEAQFGDFANGAQVLIDNFVASGESKWLVESNIVMLLPHGHEGQGPDHSSGRVERFLQLIDEPHPNGFINIDLAHRQLLLEAFEDATGSERSSGQMDTKQMVQLVMKLVTQNSVMSSLLPTLEFNHWNRESVFNVSNEICRSFDNMRVGDSLHNSLDWLVFCSAIYRRIAERDINMFVTNPSTPANYFHLLRRQVHRSYSKPLIVMSPKFLHHHTPCSSQLSEFSLGTGFRRLILDEPANPCEPHQMEKVLFCSGKLSYELRHARKVAKRNDVVVVRVEQIAPFPSDRIAQVLMRYPNAKLAWVQEEPRNQGCWSFVRDRIQHVCRAVAVPLSQNEFDLEEAQIGEQRLRYIGREVSASSAAGTWHVHKAEQQEVINQCFAEW